MYSNSSVLPSIPQSIGYTFLNMAKRYVNYIYLVQFKCTKMHKEEIPSIGSNILKFLCVPLYTYFLSVLHKEFRVAPIYDTSIGYQICCFCYN